jgi:hypothetical protein
MGDTTEQDQAESDPARAFEALRAEVGAVRRAMEALPEAWEEVRPPDYSSDLGRISKSLATAATKLEAMETHPALRLTPEQHQAAVARAAEGLMRDALQKLDRAAQEAERERHQLAFRPADRHGAGQAGSAVLAHCPPGHGVRSDAVRVTDLIGLAALRVAERRRRHRHGGGPVGCRMDPAEGR